MLFLRVCMLPGLAWPGAQMAVRRDARRVGLRAIRKAAIARALDMEALSKERREAAQALARTRWACGAGGGLGGGGAPVGCNVCHGQQGILSAGMCRHGCITAGMIAASMGWHESITRPVCPWLQGLVQCGCRH